MKIKFLTKNEAIEMFTDPDEYALKLPLSNLKMVCPQNPTLEGYQQLFLDSFDDFNEDEISNIIVLSEKLFWLNLEIKLIKTKGTHRFDVPQTRKDAIMIKRGIINDKFFIHEVYHILSRKYPEVTPILSNIFGFNKINEQVINHENFLLNPDAVICDYAIELLHNNQKIMVTPYITSTFSTGLKVANCEQYIDSKDTNYSDIIPNTTYLAHPEEICAEYFALIHLGTCYNYKQPKDNDLHKIELYRTTLEQICKKHGLIKDKFPIKPQ